MSELPAPISPIVIEEYKPRLPHVTPGELALFLRCSQNSAQRKMAYLRDVLGKKRLPHTKKQWQRVTWAEAYPFL